MKTAVAFLNLALGAAAVNIMAYSGAACSGDLLVCSNVPAGRCCAAAGYTLHSCKSSAGSGGIKVFADNTCAAGSQICGTDGTGCCGTSLQLVKGCSWIAAGNADPEEKRDADASAECADFTHRGLAINGKRYTVEKRGASYMEYMALNTRAEKEAFLLKRADLVEDDD